MFFLLIAIAVVTAAPLLAAVLVTAASLREDYDQSLAGRPPGPVTAAARWLLRARVGSVTGRPGHRLRLRPRRRRDQQAENITRERPGPWNAAGQSQWVPRPRQAADDNPDRAETDGIHYDGVHPDGAEHTVTVPRR
jgi:hypothetical protein